MPCRDYMGYTVEDPYTGKLSSQVHELKERLDMLSRIACRALTALEEVAPRSAVLTEPETSQWWAAHKIADAKAEAEKQAREALKAKKTAEAKKKKELLDKLTPEERKILGV